MRKIFAIALALVCGGFILAAPAVYAGDAGCGLGSLVWKDNKIVSQVFAATTNLSTFTQLFGITSGTSNCSSNGFTMIDKEQIFFAESNLPRLSVEMAQGNGENLEAFALVLGCENSALEEFKRLSKAKYPRIFPSENTNAVDMLHSLKQEMLRDFVLSSSCSKIS